MAALSRADESTHTFSIKESKKHAEIICRSSKSNLTMEVASRTLTKVLELLHLPYFCIAVLSGRNDGLVIQPNKTGDLRLRMSIYKENVL